MKYFSLGINFVLLLMTACNAQEKKKVESLVDNTFISIEDRQKKSIQEDGLDKITAEAFAFNFRLAARKATPGVVHIKSTMTVKMEREVPDFFRDFFDDEFWRRNFPYGDNTPRTQMGSASGVIITKDGFIVTNNHVVDKAESIEVVLYDQRSYTAKIVGQDPATDLALLKIDEKNLTFVEFGNSDSVEVGDMVLAVGNPFNLASTVTAGIVSAKARNINILTDNAAIESYIQTDAAVNRGNSGGALVDTRGRLIGINSAISTPTGVYAGYSFAIPVEIVKKTINDLLKFGKVMRGYLGVIISDLNGQRAKTLGIGTTSGVMVDSLQENGAAMLAGIKAKDIITKIDNHRVSTSTQLRELVTRHRPGEKVKVLVVRGGREIEFMVTLMALKDTAEVKTSDAELLKKLGIEVENLSEKEKQTLKIPGGMKVIKIYGGIIEQYTNMREGFIVTKVNGKRIRNIGEFSEEVKSTKGGIMLEGIYPTIPGVYYYAFGIQ